jgi:uncharacterized lipoprotein YmbA
MKNPTPLSSVLNRLLPVLLALTLAGCASSGGSAVNYYLLTPDAGARVVNKPGLTVGVGPVELPEYLSRSQVLVQVGNSRVVADRQHRWAGPLQKNFTDVLTSNIARRLGSADVVIYPWESPGSVDRQVVIKVTRFIASDSGVHLDARWRLLDRKGDQVQSGNISLTEPADIRDYDAIVTAMSSITGRFADRIVQLL